MSWSNESEINFLELYQTEPVLWDPTHMHHKDKKHLHDAWVRISEQTGYAIPELKKKRDSLMATFRGHIRKIKNSQQSGSGSDQIYKPIWFAFELMNSFLGSVYECRNSRNTEDQAVDTQLSADTEIQNDENLDTTNLSSPSSKQSYRRRKNPPELLAAEKQMAAAFNTLNNVLNKNQSTEDDCELYCKLLAKRLRKLPEKEREYFMFKIDELWWSINQVADCGFHSSGAATFSNFATVPAMQSINHFRSPSPLEFCRPPSAQSTCSQSSSHIYSIPRPYNIPVSYIPPSSPSPSSSSHSLSMPPGTPNEHQISYMPDTEPSHSCQATPSISTVIHSPENIQSTPKTPYILSMPSFNSQNHIINTSKKIKILTNIPFKKKAHTSLISVSNPGPSSSSHLSASGTAHSSNSNLPLIGMPNNNKINKAFKKAMEDCEYSEN